MIKTLEHNNVTLLPAIPIEPLGTYEGEWVKGKREGKGKFIFKDKSTFEGYFK